jgi:tRNA-2-methylthio-N6-dimethylallyladenosine synthase
MSESIHIPLASLLSTNAEEKSGRFARLKINGGAPENSVPETGRTFYIETFGCQMNEHDSEKVAGVLLRRGYRQVKSPDEARLVFYNTCSIREKAAQKVFSRLGEFNPRNNFGRESGKVIGVLGCVAQQEGEEIFERAPWVSLVCGSASYRKLPLLLERLEAGENRVTGLETDTDEAFETEFTRRDHPFRAYLTIIEGCDKACSYCVVPYTRGPERSRASDSILREVRELAAVGYTEIQFLGQTVNSYRDPSDWHLTFSELLLAAAEIPGIRRVRFMTSHPRDLGADVIEAIDASPALCDHIHLPVQSGSTRVLRAMQRTYTRNEYLEKIDLIRRARRPISVTTDIIVGFPGETEQEFDETLSLLDAAQFDGAFSFQYSPRPHTPAAVMADPVPEGEKLRRLQILQERQRAIQTRRNQALIGRVFEVLVEGASRRETQWTGRTSSNRVLNFTSSRTDLLGEYVRVRVTGAGPNSLTGEESIE